MRKLKQKLLSILLATAMLITMAPIGSLSAFAEGELISIDAVTFPDEIFRSYVSDNIDSDKDGQLSQEEINNVTTINVQKMGISDLRGVEFFSNLTGLDCSDNNLTELDISGTKIYYLDCSNNQLKSLQLPTGGLGRISCNNNHLTSLFNMDDAPMWGIKFEDYNTNQTSTADIKNVGGRWTVDFSDLIGNENPEHVVLYSSNWSYDSQTKSAVYSGEGIPQILSYSYSWMWWYENAQGFNVTLTLNELPLQIDEEHFPYERFRSFVSDNYDRNHDGNLSQEEIDSVVEMKISLYDYKTDRTELTGIEYFTALESLECRAMPIFKIDLSKNVNLKSLMLEHVTLTELDLSNNRLLNQLYLGVNHLATFDLDFEIENLEINFQADVEADIYRNKVDFNEIVGRENLAKVELADNENWQYDSLTGSAAYLGEDTPKTIKYFYHGKNLPEKGMEVNVTLYPSQYPSQIPIDEEHFPYEKFRNFVSYNYDSNHDGNLSQEEIDSVVEMKLSQLFDYPTFMADLTGIEYFTALESLECTSMPIFKIDLSKNVNLKSLIFEHVVLTELDLSNNRLLNKLVLGANHLATFDLDFEIENLVIGFQGDVKATIEHNEVDFNEIVGSENLAKVELADKENWQYDSLTGIAAYLGDDTPKTITYFYHGKNLPEKGMEVLVTLEDSTPIDEEHFPCEIFRNFVSDNYDRNHDGKLSREEIDSVVEMKLSQLFDYPVVRTDLTGIEYFTALESLECSEMPIFEIDLSKNVNLKSLSFERVSLTELDLSNNRLLNRLYLGFNRLMTFDLDFEIKDIVLDFNSCIEVGIDHKKVDFNEIVGSENLAKVELADKENWQYDPLTGIAAYLGKDAPETMEYFYHGKNLPEKGMKVELRLSLIPINDETFPDEIFRKYVSDNFDKNSDGILDYTEAHTVDKIAVSGVSDLTGIEIFPFLTELDCSNGSLTELDISKNTRLKSLNCANNCLTNLDLERQFDSLIVSPQRTLETEVKFNTTIVDFNKIVGSENCSKVEISEDEYGWSYSPQDGKAFFNMIYLPRELSYIYHGKNLPAEGMKVTLTLKEEIIEINEENFPDSLFRDYVLLFIDLNGNKRLENYEVWNYGSEMDISNLRYIEDLKGIEYLEINSLNCSGCALEELDVSGLKYLDCSNNNLKKLTGDCYRLETLICNKNSLENLSIYNVSSSLTRLECANNQLKEMPDLWDAYKLAYLDCSNNNISELNLLSNYSLTDVICSNNSLKELSLSYHEQLKKLVCDHNANLKALYLINDTSLSDLDCSFNDNLSVLDLSTNTGLETLQCQNSQLARLDLSNNTKLVTLHCENNRLSELDLSNNKMLKELTCHFNQMPKFDTFNTYNSYSTDDQYGIEAAINDGKVDFNEVVGAENLSKVELAEESDWTYDQESGIASYLGKGHPVVLRYYYNGRGIAERHMNVTLNLKYDYEFSVAINEETFPDKIFREYVIKNFDTDSDGTLSYDEIVAADTISLGYTETEDLTGIEYFIFLTSLNVWHCNITKLDLSNNVLLDTLVCSENALEELKLNNPVLNNLSCRDMKWPINHKLDLSNCPRIKWLNCMNSGISELVFNEHAVLWGITCSWNTMPKLDIKNASDMDYGSYNIGEQSYWVDFVDNKVDFNKIVGPQNCSKVELSQCIYTDEKTSSALDDWEYDPNTGIAAYHGEKALKSLVYYYNGDNIKPHGMKVYMYLKDNGIPANEETFPDQALLDCISDNFDVDGDGYLSKEEVAAVTEIDLSDKGITDLTGLESFKNLTSLDCSDNDIKEIDLSACRELTYLDCHGNQLTSLNLSFVDVEQASKGLAMKAISRGVGGCMALKYLDCSGNDLTTLDVSACPALETLNCSDNRLTLLNVSTCTELTSIRCENNCLAELDCVCRIDDASCVSNQNVESAVKNIDNKWVVDFSDIVNSENISKISIVNDERWQYDFETGLAFYSDDEWPEELSYVYYGDNISEEGMDVTLRLSQEKFSRTIVMKKELTEACVDGVMRPTTEYEGGIMAKAMSTPDGYVLPLRFIAEKFHMTVDYLGDGKTKITDADGTYLIVNKDSTLITKYNSDDTVRREIENKIATYTENGITYVPLRAVSEGIGLGVSYVGSGETGHGSYVVISTNKEIDSDKETVNAEIDKAYALGL